LKKLRDKAVTLDMRQVYKKGVEASRTLFAKAAADKAISKKEVEEFVQPFIDEMDREASITRLLNKLQSKDEYTFQHTINIGVLSMMTGKWLGLKGQELHKLILAGTLHDIGKSKIPVNILNKPGPLTRDEYSLMKNHTIYGYELLEKSDQYDETVKLAVLQHHERIDGTGYPHKIRGKKIHEFSKIVAVADVYHAMTSRRVYKERITPLAALDYLNKNIDSLDTQVTLVFIEKMLSSLQSCQVVLSNNAVCDIIYIDRQNIARPLVKVRDSKIMIDLKTRDDVHIVDLIYNDD